VKVGQPLLGQHVEGEGGANGVGDPLCLLPQPALEFVGAGVGLGRHEVGRVPDVALALVGLPELAHGFLEVAEYFDLECEVALGLGGDAHDLPGSDVGTRPRKTASHRNIQ